MTTYGLSVLYLPFFLTGHVAAILSGADTGGYSPPYQLAIRLSLIFYLLLGLFFLAKTLRFWFNSLTINIIFISLVFGTNIFWFAVYENPISHIYNFFLFSVLMYLSIKWIEKNTWLLTFLIGLTAGLIILIRPTNIIILLLFLLPGVDSWSGFTKRIQLLLGRYKHLLLIGILVFLVWLPQMLFWKMNTGSYLYYSYGEDEGFFFNNPQILSVLFGFRKGWYIYTPLMLIASVGIILLFRNLKSWFLMITVFFVLNVYVVSSWWCWWYGGGFGLRAFIDFYPLMAIPLGVLLNSSRKRLIIILTGVLMLTATGWNLLKTYQYSKGALNYDSNTRETFFKGMYKLKPTVELLSYFVEPDYTNARKGIYSPRVFYDGIESWKMYLTKPYKVLPGSDNLTEFALWQMFPEKFTPDFPPDVITILKTDLPFTFNFVIRDITPNEWFKISFKRKAGADKIILVASDDLGGKFLWVAESKGKPIGKTTWEIVEMDLKIPETMRNQVVKIYLWNTTGQPQEIGDFFISKINNGW